MIGRQHDGVAGDESTGISMRTSVILAAVLLSTAALAQTPAPMVGDQPLVQIKPKAKGATKPAQAAAAAPAAATAAPAAAGEPAAVPTRARAKSAKPGAKPPVANQLQACLELEDGTKERLDCYDAVFPPKPAAKGAKPKAAKAVAECRFSKEEDERLACYNGFADAIPKLPKS